VNNRCLPPHALDHRTCAEQSQVLITKAVDQCTKYNSLYIFLSPLFQKARMSKEQGNSENQIKDTGNNDDSGANVNTAVESPSYEAQLHTTMSNLKVNNYGTQPLKRSPSDELVKIEAWGKLDLYMEACRGYEHGLKEGWSAEKLVNMIDNVVERHRAGLAGRSAEELLKIFNDSKAWREGRQIFGG
jgi:hypothetical protein